MLSSKKRNFENVFSWQVIAWCYLCQEGRNKNGILVDIICFGQKRFGAKAVKIRKNYKNTVKMSVMQGKTLQGRHCSPCTPLASLNLLHLKLYSLSSLYLACVAVAVPGSFISRDETALLRYKQVAQWPLGSSAPRRKGALPATSVGLGE